VNLDTFCETLAGQYRTLFASDPDYAHVASQLTPEALARKMTLGLDNGTANKDGKAIRNACRVLGIDYTYKAIREYLALASPTRKEEQSHAMELGTAHARPRRAGVHYRS
jgi:hypothetical protein